MKPNQLRGWLLATLISLTLTTCSANPIGTLAPTANVPPAALPATSIPTAVPTTTPTQAETVSTPAPISPTAAPTEAAAVPPRPDCNTTLTLTPSQTEGPYYKADTPERTDLATDTNSGTPIVVTGYVLTPDCQPVAGAWLDFWQADGDGEYDNAGYNFRGHQTTDETGRYQLETVIPGLYTGRTRHIHVKVQAPNGPILTTQLYFPAEAANDRDGIFDPALIVDVQNTPAGEVALFNFVINPQ